MDPKRKGVSAAAPVAVVILVVVLAFAAYALYAPSSKAAASASSLVSTSATSPARQPSPMTTYTADAYTAEVSFLLNGFSSSTGAQVAPPKSGGAFADANQIAAGAPDDVFVSVALTAESSQYLKNLTSNWAVGFASDKMVLAYSNATLGSAAANVIGLASAAEKSNATSDWNAFFTALTAGAVKVGISSPVSDPAGLRGWLALEAAGYLYSNANQTAYVSPLLRSNANTTGTNAAALVAPLESGQVQFLFTYKSAAVSDHLQYLTLDSHVDLGNPSLASFYSKFSYTDSAGTTAGSPIVLSVTVPLSAVNTAEALQFVQYVVESAKGLSNYGLSPFSPALLYNNTTPPSTIERLVSQGLIANAGALP